jgi:hypothetical protein
MTLRNLTLALAGAAFLSSAPAAPALAAEKAKAAATASKAIDPAALKAGQRMGAYLRTLKSFEVVSSATLQELTDTGGKVETAVKTTYRVRRPDGFVIDMTTDKKARRFLYDGKSFTVFAPRVGYFASISAPETIDQTTDLIYDQYGVILPLADLFYWGTSATPTDLLTSARSLGGETIDGVQTDHYAYGGDDFAWEVWIQRGAQPLPRKMVITTVDDPARPTFTANLSWTPVAAFAPETFIFKPASDAKPIAMARVEP